MGLDTKTYWLADRQSQYDFDFDLRSSVHKCGGGVEYLHRDPASRRRQQKGKSQFWKNKIWSRIPRDSNPSLEIVKWIIRSTVWLRTINNWTLWTPHEKAKRYCIRSKSRRRRGSTGHSRSHGPHYRDRERGSKVLDDGDTSRCPSTLAVNRSGRAGLKEGADLTAGKRTTGRKETPCSSWIVGRVLLSSGIPVAGHLCSLGVLLRVVNSIRFSSGQSLTPCSSWIVEWDIWIYN
jgi:hypothetical protein